jgi:hypothetical protein
VSLERLSWDEGTGVPEYRRRPGHDSPGGGDDYCDTRELLGRILMHRPEPRRHSVRYYGACSNVVRARRRAAARDLLLEAIFRCRPRTLV